MRSEGFSYLKEFSARAGHYSIAECQRSTRPMTAIGSVIGYQVREQTTTRSIPTVDGV